MTLKHQSCRNHCTFFYWSFLSPHKRRDLFKVSARFNYHLFYNISRPLEVAMIRPIRPRTWKMALASVKLKGHCHDTLVLVQKAKKKMKLHVNVCSQRIVSFVTIVHRPINYIESVSLLSSVQLQWNLTEHQPDFFRLRKWSLVYSSC